MPLSPSRQFLKNFFQMESSGGIILMLTALLAVVAANSPWQSVYDLLLDTPVSIQIT